MNGAEVNHIQYQYTTNTRLEKYKNIY